MLRNERSKEKGRARKTAILVYSFDSRLHVFFLSLQKCLGMNEQTNFEVLDE